MRRLDESLVTCFVATPLGTMLLAAQSDALVGAWFEGQKDFPDAHNCPSDAHHPVLAQAAREINEYFAAKRQAFTVPTAFAWGTTFQVSTWNALTRIHHGHTCTYSDIAQRVGKPTAVRAIGAAIGMNPISIVVPCHRVLGRDGSLTGFAGGLERKRALLDIEHRTASLLI